MTGTRIPAHQGQRCLPPRNRLSHFPLNIPASGRMAVNRIGKNAGRLWDRWCRVRAGLKTRPYNPRDFSRRLLDQLPRPGSHAALRMGLAHAETQGETVLEPGVGQVESFAALIQAVHDLLVDLCPLPHGGSRPGSWEAARPG